MHHKFWLGQPVSLGKNSHFCADFEFLEKSKNVHEVKACVIKFVVWYFQFSVLSNVVAKKLFSSEALEMPTKKSVFFSTFFVLLPVLTVGTFSTVFKDN